MDPRPLRKSAGSLAREQPAGKPTPTGAVVLSKRAARGMSVRQRLSLIVLVVALPMLLLSAGIVWRLAERERDVSRQAILYSSHSILSAVDAQLGKYISVAQVLAASHSLHGDDLTAFRQDAEHALAALSGAVIVLADRNGQQLVNTFAAPGEPLPRLPPEAVAAQARAFETRQPQIADTAIGPVTKIPVIGVAVPVFRADGPAYCVLIAIDVTVFRDLLNSQRMPDGWLAGIIDRSGKFIARSLDHERWVGRPASAGWRSVMTRDGWFEIMSVEGEVYMSANVVSPLSGWALGAAAKKDVFEAPIRQTIVFANLAGAAVILLSILLAASAARRITAPIKALETGAHALRHHQPVSFAPTEVPEVDHALQAFAAASQELRAHEERRAETEKALKASEEQLRLFVEQAPASIAMFDRNLCYLAASRRWLTQFCPDDHDVVGRSHYEILPEIPEHWKHIHRRALAGEVLAADDDPFLRADGRTQWVSWEIRPWRGSDGVIGGIVIYADDVTARHDAVTALKASEERMIRASRLSEIGQMAAALAHELNQPLTAVASYIGGCRRILRADGNDMWRKQKLEEVMDLANAQTLRAGEIIRRLREFIGTGQTQRTVESAAGVMREASTLAVAAAKHNGVSIRSDIDKPGNILVNKVQIQQVVVNLVRNAIEAMETTARKELEIGLVVADDGIELRVSDTGSGLAPEMNDRLFRPFSTTKSQGMGIGLSVSREIVEAHDGKIWAEANPGGGTVFRFTLPLVHDEMVA